jgi:hypothetical protein
MSLLLHSRSAPAMPTPDAEVAKGARILETWRATSVNEYTTSNNYSLGGDHPVLLSEAWWLNGYQPRHCRYRRRLVRDAAWATEPRRGPPSAASFRALQPGEMFLFKLHAPRNVIVGGGIFA